MATCIHQTATTDPVEVIPNAKAAPTSSPDKRFPMDVTVQLQYLKDLPLYKTVKPLQVTPNFKDKAGKTNVVLEPGPSEVIKDVRGLECCFELDKHGFKFVKGPTAFTEWSSQPKIAEHYLPEMEELLRREVVDVDEIMFYDARIRQSGDEGLRVEGLSYNPFAKQVHRDNTDISCIEKIRNLTDLKADYLLSGRCRIINIWRPIKHPVYDCSLAVADGGKLQPDDVLECDRHLASTGAYHDTMGVIKHRPGFEWYYCSAMAPADVLLFKNFDSAEHVQAQYCLHTAFDLPPETIPPNAPPRESIEVRALIFTYPAGQRRPSRTTSPALPNHPLAHTLARGQLGQLDDEHPTVITARVRTDIDEAAEIKDAVLLLRRQEIHQLNGVCAALEAERDNLRTARVRAEMERDEALRQVNVLTTQLEIQSSRLSALERRLLPSTP